MKKMFFALTMCTMLLCISGVSYGADVGPIKKSDKTTVEFAPSNDVVITISNPSFVNDNIYEITDYGSDAMFSSPLAIETTYYDVAIEHSYIYLNNYNSYLATTPEPDKHVGLYPSNHVGKSLATLFITTLEDNHSRKITTNVGKSTIWNTRVANE